MKYSNNYDYGEYDPNRVESKALDDRNDGSVSMDEQDAFNSPEDRVAHL